MRREEEELEELAHPGVHKLSALVVAADASNKINSVRFKSGDSIVTELPSGRPFQIIVSFRVSQAYIRAKEPNPPTVQGPWGAAIVAFNMPALLAASGWWETGPLNQSILDTDFLLGDNPYPQYGYSNNLIMPASNITFVIHLVCSLSRDLVLPDPTQLALMPVQ